MANSNFIKAVVYPQLSESQIYEWRKATYSGLGNKFKYTTDELMKLTDDYTPTISDLMNEMNELINESKILGKLKYKKDSFIYIDSSSLCKLTIPTILCNTMQKHPEIKKTNLIIIFSNISKTENMYKFVNPYPCVNYDHLRFNLDLLNNKTQFKMKNVMVLPTNLYLDNKMLISEEIEHLKHYHTWNMINIKNELNDNAQINMLIEFAIFFTNKNVVLVSHDVKMCHKTQHLINSDINKRNNLYVMDRHSF
jgi:hypothetical protein